MNKRIKASVLVMFLVSLSISTIAFGFPKPSPVPMDWEIAFKFQDIKRISVAVPGEGVKNYWYMIYTITNNTGQDVTYHPEFTLVTNDFQERKSMVNVPPVVLTKITQEYKKTYPWLESPSKVIGKLLQGKDNARDSIAIWPDFDSKATSIDIYAGGLSGEITSVPNPMYKNGESDPKKISPLFVLRKTLKIHYTLPSDSANRTQVTPKRSAQDITWIMR